MSLTWLYKKEISQIIFLQTHLQKYETFLIYISEIGRPGFFFFYLLPLIAAFNTKLLAKVLFVAASSEYISVLLKWILIEDRPFWWVRETKGYGPLRRPIIRQNEITCETTPGCPSGHLMFATAVYFIILRFITAKLNARYPKQKNLIKKTFWGIYLFSTIALTISRLYVAAHFLHQCVIGGFMGYWLAKRFQYYNAKYSFFFKKRLCVLKYFFGAIIIAFILYWIQKMLGIDPQWSVRMSFKWCEKVSSLNPFSTPIYSLTRSVGAAFGLVMAAPVADKFSNTLNYKLSLPASCVLMILHKLAVQNTPKHYGAIIFFAYTFTFYSFFTFLQLWFIPKYCSVKRKVG